MKVKICCEDMKYHIGNYIRLNEYCNYKNELIREVIIDTGDKEAEIISESDEVEMKYCLFCGRKIEIIKEQNLFTGVKEMGHIERRNRCKEKGRSSKGLCTKET